MFSIKKNALSMLNAFSRQMKSNFHANIAFVFAEGSIIYELLMAFGNYGLPWLLLCFSLSLI